MAFTTTTIPPLPLAIYIIMINNYSTLIGHVTKEKSTLMANDINLVQGSSHTMFFIFFFF